MSDSARPSEMSANMTEQSQDPELENETLPPQNTIKSKAIKEGGMSARGPISPRYEQAVEAVVEAVIDQ